MKVLPEHIVHAEFIPATEQDCRKVTFLINGTLTVLKADWHWKFAAAQVFCSNTFLHFPPSLPGLTGDTMNCLLHPDDLQLVSSRLARVQEHPEGFAFRIITTYGEVGHIRASGACIVENLAREAPEGILEEESLQWKNQRDQRIQLNRAALQKLEVEDAEKLLDFGTWHYNVDSSVMYFSDGVYRVFGLPPQSLNAHFHTFHRFIHKDDRDFAIEYFERAFRMIVPLQIDFRIVWNSGEIRYVNSSTVFRFNETGALLLCGTFTDITERKLQEAQLALAEATAAFQRRTFFYTESLAGMGTYQINLTNHKTLFCDNLYALYGLKPQSVPAGILLFSHYIHADDRQRVLEAYRKAYHAGDTQELEYRIVRKDGKLRSLRERSKVMLNHLQETLIVGAVQDVTAHSTLSEMLQLQKLESDRQVLLQGLGEVMVNFGTWIHHLDKEEHHWSDQMYRIFGLKPGAAGASQNLLTRLMHPDDKVRFDNDTNLCINDSRERMVEFHLVVNGQLRYLRANLSFRNTDEGRMMITTVQNITEFTETHQNLTERLRLAEVFANGTSELMLVTDIYHTIVACNVVFLASGTRKKVDVIGSSLFNLLPISSSTQLNDGYHLALQGQTTTINDIVNLYAPGNYNLKLFPLKAATGKVEGLLHVASNITAAYKEQQQHAFRLELLEKILEISSDIVIALDRNMNYLFWNRKAELYYGIPVKDIIGKNILELFPSFIGDPSYQDLRRVMKGETLHVPRRNMGHDTEKETFLFPLHTSSDGITGVLWIVRDLELPVESGADAVDSARLLHNLNEVFFMVDASRRFTLVSIKACIEWRKSEPELLGKNVWEVFPSGKDLPFFFALEEALEQGIPCQQDFQSYITGKRQYTSITPTENGAAVLVIDRVADRPIADTVETLQRPGRADK